MYDLIEFVYGNKRAIDDCQNIQQKKRPEIHIGNQQIRCVNTLKYSELNIL